jgi:hypothetical protein
MTAKDTAASNAIRKPKADVLTLFEAGSGQVRVVPNDRDIFILSAAEAVRACQDHDMVQRTTIQMVDLLHRLGDWIDERRTEIAGAYFVRRGFGVMLLVVQASPEFNSELTDALTDLDLEIAGSEAYDLIRLDVRATPNFAEVLGGYTAQSHYLSNLGNADQE